MNGARAKDFVDDQGIRWVFYQDRPEGEYCVSAECLETGLHGKGRDMDLYRAQAKARDDLARQMNP